MSRPPLPLGLDPTIPAEGWWWPGHLPRAHFIRRRRALCGRYVYLGSGVGLEDAAAIAALIGAAEAAGHDVHETIGRRYATADHCQACARRLARWPYDRER